MRVRSPPFPPFNMKKLEAIIFIIIVLASLIYFSSQFGSLTALVSKPSTAIPSQPTALAPSTPPVKTTVTENFEELGISMEVPKNLIVAKQPVKSADGTTLEAYTFTIQNYESGQQNESANFQMYGLVQYDLPATSWGELSKVKESTETYQNIQEVSYNGVIGYYMQAKGERPRYTYMFLLTDKVLTIAVSEPTEFNKSLAESIVATVKYL
jgi:hypothetical protein